MMSVIMINECNACYISMLYCSKTNSQPRSTASCYHKSRSLCADNSTLASCCFFSFILSLNFHLFHIPVISRLCRLRLWTGLEPSKLRPVAFAVQSKNRLVFSKVLGTHLDIISVGKAKGKKRSQTKSNQHWHHKAISESLSHTSFELATPKIPRCSLVAFFFFCFCPFSFLSLIEAVLI